MKKFWIVNTINSNKAEILLYGYIMPGEINAADFIIELTNLTNTYNDVKIRINSGGGSIFDGITIYNAIRALIKSGKNITTCVDGIAASMAAAIAISGSHVEMSKYGRIMTHRAKGYPEGDVDDIRVYASMLEDAENDLAKIFAERTGRTQEDAKATFLKKGVDNWMNAAKCMEMKLVDKLYDADPVAAPENVTDEKQLHNIFETCLNKSIPQSKNTNMNKIIAKLLGLPEDATESQIEAAVTNSLAAKKTAEDAVANFAKTRAEALVNDPVNAKKYTADKKALLIENAITNYDATKAMIDMISVAQKPTDIINRANPELLNTEGGEGDAPVAVTGKSGEGWDKLVSQGMAAIEKVKKETPDVYAQLYKDKYKRDPSAMGFAKR